mmetsp:Transcript_8691/g.15905  ORF Transcript_8691/g.15905 Transcript_8691/m.15905 type:complete len:85 (+) Transcript_8691:990-1244(+)
MPLLAAGPPAPAAGFSPALSDHAPVAGWVGLSCDTSTTLASAIPQGSARPQAEPPMTSMRLYAKEEGASENLFCEPAIICSRRL